MRQHGGALQVGVLAAPPPMRHRLHPLPLQVVGCRPPVLLKPKHAWLLTHWLHDAVVERPVTDATW
jgi:hypothetical protein